VDATAATRRIRGVSAALALLLTGCTYGQRMAVTAPLTTAVADRVCRAANLQAQTEPDAFWSPMTGEQPLGLTIINRGRQACSLSGAPVVRVYDAGRGIRFRVTHRSGQYLPHPSVERIVLEPSARAYLLIDRYRCDLGAHEAGSLTVSWQGSGGVVSPTGPALVPFCSGGRADPGNLLVVSPFAASLSALKQMRQ
jgi:hypothetical protein